MSLDRKRRYRPRLVAGTPLRIVRTQGLRRPALAADSEQTKPGRLEGVLARIGSWNWAAIASVIAALAAASGVYYTGRSLDAAQAQNETTETAQLTDRYTKAVDQLDRIGPEHLQARLGGIYALERLARDSPKDHPTIVEVISAFVRTTAPSAGPVANGETACSKQRPAADIQAALTVLGRRNTAHDRKGELVDLRLTCLEGADLRHANIGAIFMGADLTGVDLDNTDLTGSDFSMADLSYASLVRARLPGAFFTMADLTGAKLVAADLTSANLNGTKLFHADLANANLYQADLSNTRLEDADLTNTNLCGAHLFLAGHNENTVVNGARTDDKTVGMWW